MSDAVEKEFLSALESNRNKIFRICRSYSSSHEEAKDLFQEVVFQIWKSFASFKKQSTIQTWIYRITLNICIRAAHTLKRKREFWVKLDHIEFEATETALEEDSETKLTYLSACIHELEAVNRSLILLYLEELAYREIAEVMGISENLVAVKIKRIKNKLHTCITAKL